MAGSVTPLDVAKWQDVQAELRALSMQRGLRFVAVVVLVPFGITAVGKEQEGPDLSSFVFGITLLLLAVGELASMAQSALRMRQRNDLEKTHPGLAMKGKPARLAHVLGFVSGPGFSAALYAMLAAAFLIGGSLA